MTDKITRILCMRKEEMVTRFGFAEKTVFLWLDSKWLSGVEFLQDVIFLQVCPRPNPSPSPERSPQHFVHPCTCTIRPLPPIFISPLQLGNNTTSYEGCLFLLKLWVRCFSWWVVLEGRLSSLIVMYFLKVVMYSGGAGPRSPPDWTFCHQRIWSRALCQVGLPSWHVGNWKTQLFMHTTSSSSSSENLTQSCNDLPSPVGADLVWPPQQHLVVLPHNGAPVLAHPWWRFL